MNFNLLVLMATNKQAEAGTAEVTHPALQEAVLAAKEEKAKENKAELGKLLLELLKRQEEYKRIRVQEIRRMQRRINDYKKQLDKIDAIWAKAQASSNFVPLAAELGLNYRDLRCSLEEFNELNK